MALFDFTVLRDLRRKSMLSIAEVAAASGVSAPVISKLERNQTQAELETLYRLARVFHISTADLLNLAETGLTHRLEVTSHASGDFTFKEVTYRGTRCLHGRAAAGARTTRPEIHRDDYELCWVLAGQLRLTLPAEEFLLTAPEVLEFDALLEHTYAAQSDCEILILHIKKDKHV